MHLDKTREAYVRYRIETAAENLNSAKLLYENGQLKSSANRAYYCTFLSEHINIMKRVVI